MTTTEFVPLSAHTTFHIGGRARYFVTITPDEVGAVVTFAAEKQLPLFVLGMGSNVLVDDEDLHAVVVHIVACGQIEYSDHATDPESVVCVAGAGESWDVVVADAVARGYGGIENLSLIPGSVGAAPVQNIGAYGTELADVLEWVDVFDSREQKIRRFTSAECELGYRSSFFKSSAGKQFIVVRVAMRLSKHALPNISYKDLARYFSEKGTSSPTIAEVRDAVMSIRRAKLPDPATTPNAGSFFKNPVIEKALADELHTRFPELPLFPVAAAAGEAVSHFKTSAAWIIDHVCGMRGAVRGAVGTFETQPLVIINRGDARASDVEKFSQEIISCVKEKTDIVLEPEVEFISNKNFSPA